MRNQSSSSSIEPFLLLAILALLLVIVYQAIF
jgi:hypothetical protein